MTEFIFNKEAFNELPDDLKAIARTAARAVNQNMMDEYTARNNQALISLIEDHNVILKKFPDEVLFELEKISKEVLEEFVSEDELAKEIYKSILDFKGGVSNYHKISEQAIYELR